MSQGRVLVVTGTGTGIGKTHLAEALLLAMRKTQVVTGWKPVESGVIDKVGADQARLTAASHANGRAPGEAHLALTDGLSPHLAAERQRASLPWDNWMQFARTFTGNPESLVIELAGGLYSPLSLEDDNATFARWLRTEVGLPTELILCAPDRLGVLHDVRAALRAAGASSLAVDLVVLVTPDVPDASTGTNVRELERLCLNPAAGSSMTSPRAIVGPIPRLAPAALAEHATVSQLLSS